MDRNIPNTMQLEVPDFMGRIWLGNASQSMHCSRLQHLCRKRRFWQRFQTFDACQPSMYNRRAFSMVHQTDMITPSGEQPIYYPNRLGRVVKLAIEEILGRDGGYTGLNLTDLPEYRVKFPRGLQDPLFSFMHISTLQAGLENMYGSRAGRGLALRVGRACLKHGLREFGSELGLTDLTFRLLPIQAKLRTCTEAFAALFNTYTDQKICLEMDEKYIFWLIERCPLCRERQADGPCCHLAVGFLQEAMFWVSGGKHFSVEEKTCIACGDSACTIQIGRIPLS
jgi:predicted hydrocarbon binding protein